jgi:Antirestriction protein (ArdA)
VIPLWSLKPFALANPSLADGQGLYSQTLNHGKTKEMTNLYAQPYDISAHGFYFESADEYTTRASKLLNSYGDQVEEFEIQFIDGDGIDCQLFEALSVSQCNLEAYFEAAENWNEDQKIKVIIAVGEVGYKFDLGKDSPDDFDVTLYQLDSMRELAEQFIDEGMFGEIPEAIQSYIDYDAIARDLKMDYSEITIDGTRYIYRCD